MQMYGIDLQRISLCALIIALGMLVDNAIVIAEGMMIRIQSGMNAAKAAMKWLQEMQLPCWEEPLSVSWLFLPLVYAGFYR